MLSLGEQTTGRRLFDAHCHLQDERLAPELDAVLARARAAGVTRMACCGSAESDWARVAERTLEETARVTFNNAARLWRYE